MAEFLNGTMGLASRSAFCPDWLIESFIQNVSCGPEDRDGILGGDPFGHFGLGDRRCPRSKLERPWDAGSLLSSEEMAAVGIDSCFSLSWAASSSRSEGATCAFICPFLVAFNHFLPSPVLRLCPLSDCKPTSGSSRLLCSCSLLLSPPGEVREGDLFKIQIR